MITASTGRLLVCRVWRALEPLATSDQRSEEFLGGVPPVTFSEDATGGFNLLPRMAWGVNEKNGVVVVVVVDGRNPSLSVGATLEDMGQLLKDLGATIGINLDGGSSIRLVVDGDRLDSSQTGLKVQPDESANVRPVWSAILIGSRQPGIPAQDAE